MYVIGYFKHLGADIVLDMQIADDLALLESQREFVERYKTQMENPAKHIPMLASSCPGIFFINNFLYNKIIVFNI